MTMIKRISVDWMDGYANTPRFIVELDNPEAAMWPKSTEPAWFNCKGVHLAPYFDDVIRPYFYSDGEPCQGFGGAEFSGIMMDTGKPFKYRGAWSSRAACVNAAFPEDKVVDVSVGYRATAVCAYAFIQAWRAPCATCDFGLAWIDNGDQGEILLPTRHGQLKNMRGVKSVRHLGWAAGRSSGA
jgi:hypothetical protein